MHNDLDQILQNASRRTRRYWSEDGLPEIFVGALFLVLAGYFYLLSVLPSSSLFASLLQPGFAVLVIGSVFLGRRLIDALKNRLTYPRTGYLSYPQPSNQRRWMAAGTAAMLGAVFAAWIVNSSVSFDWIPAITGLVVAAIGVVSGMRMALARFYLLAALSLALGLLLAAGWLGELPALAVYYGLIGLAMLLSGNLALRRYLQQTEALNPGAEDER